MNRIGPILGILLVLASNAIALIGVSGNRLGEPVQTFELTERELPMESREKEDSSISLRFAWTRYFEGPQTNGLSRKPPFDSAKLKELGFACRLPADASAGYRTELPRVAFVAFEYDAKAPQQELKKPAEIPVSNVQPGRPASREIPARARQEKTGLTVVDASVSFAQLRSKYLDSRKYLIVRGVVRAALEQNQDSQKGASAAPRWVGYVTQVLPPSIHVPLPYSRELSGLAPRSEESPRYRVTVHYGHDLEPWVDDVKLLSH